MSQRRLADLALQNHPLVITDWYARGGDVVRMGPFATQAAASRALVLVGTASSQRFPPNAFVWPEERLAPSKRSR